MACGGYHFAFGQACGRPIDAGAVIAGGAACTFGCTCVVTWVMALVFDSTCTLISGGGTKGVTVALVSELALVDIRVQPEGSVVSVDDNAIGPAPLQRGSEPCRL